MAPTNGIKTGEVNGHGSYPTPTKVNGITNGVNGHARANGHARTNGIGPREDYDVLIMGAGLSGIYSLYRMNQLNLKAKVLEAGSGEGGTWFWNTYPGARFDSESCSYIFSFSQEVLDEWDWSETFAGQPETLRYCQFLVDKFRLRKDMQFNTRVKSAHYQEVAGRWLLTDESGHQYSSQYLITAMGILNQPVPPAIPGVRDFKGFSWHTARWPKDHSDLRGKRVGIIGTGATAIQIIQSINDMIGHLTVFQRTPNWTGPIRNEKLTPEGMEKMRKNYPDTFYRCSLSTNCFIHKTDLTRTVFSESEEERNANWERLYSMPGASKILGVSKDIATDREANALYSEFHANKVRQRVKDPKTAEKLIPKNHGFGTRRVPLEDGYYEVFNQDNVDLVDLHENPIVKIVENGIETQEGLVELDIIIYATGFDAVTGSFRAVDFRGRNGTSLQEDIWSEGIQTYLGLTVRDFPNMFMIMGPHQQFGNIPRSIEYAVEWVSDLLEWAQKNRVKTIEATDEKMDEWTQHVADSGKGLLMNEVSSWMTGVNTNLGHKQKRSMTRYNGGALEYRKRCNAVKAREYADFVITR